MKCGAPEKICFKEDMIRPNLAAYMYMVYTIYGNQPAYNYLQAIVFSEMHCHFTTTMLMILISLHECTRLQNITWELYSYVQACRLMSIATPRNSAL